MENQCLRCVNGRTNISMKTFFFIILILMNIPVLLFNICQGGSITLKYVPIYVVGFEK